MDLDTLMSRRKKSGGKEQKGDTSTENIDKNSKSSSPIARQFLDRSSVTVSPSSKPMSPLTKPNSPLICSPSYKGKKYIILFLLTTLIFFY